MSVTNFAFEAGAKFTLFISLFLVCGYMDEIYRDMILDLYRNPLNKGVLEDFDASAQEVNPSCGDEIMIYIKLGKDGSITNIAHDGQGCAISQASVSLLADAVKGKSTDAALEMTEQEVYDLLRIPISYTRRGCALLGLRAIQKALRADNANMNE